MRFGLFTRGFPHSARDVVVDGRRVVVRSSGTSVAIPAGTHVSVPAGGARDAFGNTNATSLLIR